MVRPRLRAVRRRSRRRGNRSQQQIARIASNTLLRTRMPADPPTLAMATTITKTVAFRIFVNPDSTATSFTYYEAARQSAVASVGTKSATEVYPLSPINITPKELATLVLSTLFGSATASASLVSTVDIALLKCNFWGSATGTKLPISLLGEVGGLSSGIALEDEGTSANRPRCGFSCPILRWFAGNDTSINLAVLEFKQNVYKNPSPKAEPWVTIMTQELGVIHLTAALRTVPA